jgi:hypothetical protein
MRLIISRVTTATSQAKQIPLNTLSLAVALRMVDKYRHLAAQNFRLSLL